MKMQAYSLLIDGEVYPITALSKRIQNGLFNVEFNLSSREKSALRKAEYVGVAVRFTYEAPVFFGFDRMRLTDGKQKPLGILNQCE